MRAPRWAPQEDALLAKIIAGARGPAAPDTVRGISPTNPAFVRYVAKRFRAEIPAAAAAAAAANTSEDLQIHKKPD